jgi:replicative DNA helicase
MFSQEMLAVQIARRAIAAESGVPTWRQRKASIDFADFDALTAAAKKLEAMPIYIDQTANQKVSQIVRKTRHMKKLYGISFVVVDHLLEIRAEHAKQSKFDVIENAARELKKLAKEENVTVLLLAQVTREAQKRDHWRVRDQDLFGGDVVKQSSDVMFSVSIPTVFIQQREPRPGTEDLFQVANRDGSSGSAKPRSLF